MSTVTDIRTHFPDAEFGPPCSESDIAQAEGQLGYRLPSEIRELYAAFNGFRGPGNAAYLFPLHGGGSSLVDMTLLFRDWESPKLAQFVFYGSTAFDECLGLSLTQPREIIRYHHHMEDEFESGSATILETYLADKAKWSKVADA